MASVAFPATVSDIQADFGLGIVRDRPRSAIPRGGVYDLLDCLVDLPGKAYKRGGTVSACDPIADYALLVAVAAPEFPGDPRVWVIASDGSNKDLFDVTSGTAAMAVEVNDAQPIENPPGMWLNDTTGYVSILCDGIGDGMGTFEDVQVVYLNSSTLDADTLSATAPNARYSCPYLGRLVLANGTDPNDSDAFHPNRLWFSPLIAPATPLGAADVWDTANAYIDMDEPIVGLSAIQSVLIVFTRGSATAFSGGFPPGSVDENGDPNGDMREKAIGSVGCADARSIVRIDNKVYFANESGVYYTNGVGYESITDKDNAEGISGLWAESMAGFAPAIGAVVSAGVWLNSYLLLTIRHADDDEENPGARYQFLYFEPTKAWMRLGDGATATMYATRFAPNGELYACPGDLSDPVQLLKMSPILDPTVDNAQDANGEDIPAVLETRPIGQGPGLKHYEFAHTTYDLRDPESANPVILVTQSVGVEATTFASPPEGATLAETTDAVRKRTMLAKEGQGLSLRYTLSGGAWRSEIYSIEVGYRVDPLSMET